MSVDTIAERALRGIAAAHAMGPAPLRPGAALPPFALRSVWTDAVVTQEDIARLGHPAVLIVCPPSRLSAAASREHAPESPELNRSGAECGSVEGHDATGFFDPSRASELTSIADAAADRGVTVVAVVSRPPATPAEELVARRLGFHALVDPTLAFARALGVVCDVSPAATALCSQWGADIHRYVPSSPTVAVATAASPPHSDGSSQRQSVSFNSVIKLGNDSHLNMPPKSATIGSILGTGSLNLAVFRRASGNTDGGLAAWMTVDGSRRDSEGAPGSSGLGGVPGPNAARLMASLSIDSPGSGSRRRINSGTGSDSLLNERGERSALRDAPLSGAPAATAVVPPPALVPRASFMSFASSHHTSVGPALAPPAPATTSSAPKNEMPSSRADNPYFTGAFEKNTPPAPGMLVLSDSTQPPVVAEERSLRTVDSEPGAVPPRVVTAQDDDSSKDKGMLSPDSISSPTQRRGYPIPTRAPASIDQAAESGSSRRWSAGTNSDGRMTDEATSSTMALLALQRRGSGGSFGSGNPPPPPFSSAAAWGPQGQGLGPQRGWREDSSGKLADSDTGTPRRQGNSAGELPPLAPLHSGPSTTSLGSLGVPPPQSPTPSANGASGSPFPTPPSGRRTSNRSPTSPYRMVGSKHRPAPIPAGAMVTPAVAPIPSPVSTPQPSGGASPNTFAMQPTGNVLSDTAPSPVVEAPMQLQTQPLPQQQQAMQPAQPMQQLEQPVESVVQHVQPPPAAEHAGVALQQTPPQQQQTSQQQPNEQFGPSGFSVEGLQAAITAGIQQAVQSSGPVPMGPSMPTPSFNGNTAPRYPPGVIPACIPAGAGGLVPLATVGMPPPSPFAASSHFGHAPSVFSDTIVDHKRSSFTSSVGGELPVYTTVSTPKCEQMPLSAAMEAAVQGLVQDAVGRALPPRSPFVRPAGGPAARVTSGLHSFAQPVHQQAPPSQAQPPQHSQPTLQPQVPSQAQPPQHPQAQQQSPPRPGLCGFPPLPNLHSPSRAPSTVGSSSGVRPMVPRTRSVHSGAGVRPSVSMPLSSVGNAAPPPPVPPPMASLVDSSGPRPPSMPAPPSGAGADVHPATLGLKTQETQEAVPPVGAAAAPPPMASLVDGAGVRPLPPLGFGLAPAPLQPSQLSGSIGDVQSQPSPPRAVSPTSTLGSTRLVQNVSLTSGLSSQSAPSQPPPAAALAEPETEANTDKVKKPAPALSTTSEIAPKPNWGRTPTPDLQRPSLPPRSPSRAAVGGGNPSQSPLISQSFQRSAFSVESHPGDRASTAAGPAEPELRALNSYTTPPGALPLSPVVPVHQTVGGLEDCRSEVSAVQTPGKSTRSAKAPSESSLSAKPDWGRTPTPDLGRKSNASVVNDTRSRSGQFSPMKESPRPSSNPPTSENPSKGGHIGLGPLAPPGNTPPATPGEATNQSAPHEQELSQPLALPHVFAVGASSCTTPLPTPGGGLPPRPALPDTSATSRTHMTASSGMSLVSGRRGSSSQTTSMSRSSALAGAASASIVANGSTSCTTVMTAATHSTGVAADATRLEAEAQQALAAFTSGRIPTSSLDPTLPNAGIPIASTPIAASAPAAVEDQEEHQDRADHDDTPPPLPPLWADVPSPATAPLPALGSIVDVPSPTANAPGVVAAAARMPGNTTVPAAGHEGSGSGTIVDANVQSGDTRNALDQSSGSQGVVSPETHSTLASEMKQSDSLMKFTKADGTGLEFLGRPCTPPTPKNAHRSSAVLSIASPSRSMPRPGSQSCETDSDTRPGPEDIDRSALTALQNAQSRDFRDRDAGSPAAPCGPAPVAAEARVRHDVAVKEPRPPIADRVDPSPTRAANRSTNATPPMHSSSTSQHGFSMSVVSPLATKEEVGPHPRGPSEQDQAGGGEPTSAAANSSAFFLSSFAQAGGSRDVDSRGVGSDARAAFPSLVLTPSEAHSPLDKSLEAAPAMRAGAAAGATNGVSTGNDDDDRFGKGACLVLPAVFVFMPVFEESGDDHGASDAHSVPAAAKPGTTATTVTNSSGKGSSGLEASPDVNANTPPYSAASSPGASSNRTAPQHSSVTGNTAVNDFRLPPAPLSEFQLRAAPRGKSAQGPRHCRGASGDQRHITVANNETTSTVENRTDTENDRSTDVTGGNFVSFNDDGLMADLPVALELSNGSASKQSSTDVTQSPSPIHRTSTSALLKPQMRPRGFASPDSSSMVSDKRSVPRPSPRTTTTETTSSASPGAGVGAAIGHHPNRENTQQQQQQQGEGMPPSAAMPPAAAAIATTRPTSSGGSLLGGGKANGPDVAATAVRLLFDTHLSPPPKVDPFGAVRRAVRDAEDDSEGCLSVSTQGTASFGGAAQSSPAHATTAEHAPHPHDDDTLVTNSEGHRPAESAPDLARDKKQSMGNYNGSAVAPRRTSHESTEQTSIRCAPLVALASVDGSMTASAATREPMIPFIPPPLPPGARSRILPAVGRPKRLWGKAADSAESKPPKAVRTAVATTVLVDDDFRRTIGAEGIYSILMKLPLSGKGQAVDAVAVKTAQAVTTDGTSSGEAIG